MTLSLSHTTGPSEPALRDLTLGQLLAWAAETTPERVRCARISSRANVSRCGRRTCPSG